MSEKKTPNWKKTLNLPRTGFPMKAQLNRMEPKIIKKWQESDMYQQVLKAHEDHSPFILHDGPPYANGHIHLGHALNKILKDFIVRAKTMEGHYAPYVPGWDCHGLPIEHQVDQELGGRRKTLSVPDKRQKCRHYAEKFLKLQMEEFIRLGITGDWKHPYKTLQHEYEAGVIDFVKSFAKNKSLYRRKRPVYWCHSCQTALAEAEVEYHDHSSSSIYVKFPLTRVPEFLKPHVQKQIYVLIWTTTPWTIPANMAIAFNPEFDYSLFEMNGEQYIAATRLIPVLSEISKSEYKILHEFKGSMMEGFAATHPLYPRESLLICADYVGLDQGTGCVHTAPGHGDEDYRSGLRYGLDIYSPVQDDGTMDATAGDYEGLHVDEVNKRVREDLETKGFLFYSEEYSHSYPHCWRCRKPVIFRATAQWFVSMDKTDLRINAVESISDVKWFPAWGEDRMKQMVTNRPDWCISRQRDWGVPIPVFYCEECQEALVDIRAMEKVRDIFREKGSDSWYELPVEAFLPEQTRCPHCDSSRFRKGRDILDVWFESGSSFSVLENFPGHSFPADIYLEGGDQYRGWFNSSLLVALNARGTAPYRTVITHGWALDNKGNAMSKSLGNVISPLEIIKDKGAEILRLWVAMANYQEDIRLGNEILSRVTDSYRKIRNTWRFMLGVLEDFDPTVHSLNTDQLRETDLYILEKLRQLKQSIYSAYGEFDTHVVFHKISHFFTVDLSSFYLNFNKDNLYCNENDSPLRRNAQATIYKILSETLLLLAPILVFTTEEAWGYLPEFSGKKESIHLHTFPKKDEAFLSPQTMEKWNTLLDLRDLVLKEIEEARNQKIIGDSLEAEVTLFLAKEAFDLVTENAAVFREILVISGLHIRENKEFRVEISRFSGNKCPRCWNWFSEDTSDNACPVLCPRCNRVVGECDEG